MEQLEDFGESRRFGILFMHYLLSVIPAFRRFLRPVPKRSYTKCRTTMKSRDFWVEGQEPIQERKTHESIFHCSDAGLVKTDNNSQTDNNKVAK